MTKTTVRIPESKMTIYVLVYVVFQSAKHFQETQEFIHSFMTCKINSAYTRLHYTTSQVSNTNTLVTSFCI